MVTRTISLMLAVAPYLTPEQVRAIVIATAKPFPEGSDCTTDRCGSGIVDAGAAVRAAAAVPPPTGPAIATAVEFYNAALDHYFITYLAAEISALDAGTTIKGWTRTGQSFDVYVAPTTVTSPVCRFYIPPDKGNSHFYGRGHRRVRRDCGTQPDVGRRGSGILPCRVARGGRTCPTGLRRRSIVFSATDRTPTTAYIVDRAIRDQMTALGWLAEGDGPDLVVMCAPA